MKCLRVLSAANSLKSCLSANEVSKSIYIGVAGAVAMFNQQGSRKISLNFISRPIADGGDGTLDCLASKIEKQAVVGPLYETVEAKWGSLKNTAIIEMAQASGIHLIKKQTDLNPLYTTTFGTGQLIKTAIQKGFKSILLTIGGSATVDGGIGALEALGMEFFDEKGRRIFAKGNQSCKKIFSMNPSKFIKLFHDVKISIACDTESKLLGKTGSALTAGPQKTSPLIKGKDLQNLLTKLESNLENLNTAIIRTSGKDISNSNGCGCAGGISLGFCAFANAKLQKGAKLVMKLLEFEKLDADLVFTSEGFADQTTLMGKAPFEVCVAKKKPFVSLLLGGVESHEQKFFQIDLNSFLANLNLIIKMFLHKTIFPFLANLNLVNKNFFKLI